MSALEFPSADELTFDDVPFRGIVEQSLAGVYVVLDERFMYANDTFAAMFGYTREEFIGRHMIDCVTPDSVAEVMQNYHKRISGQVQTIHYFTKGVRKDGEIVHLELHASRVLCRGRPALTGVALNVTDQVLAQQALRHSREQLRELARHVNQTREIERARLAREVHDVLGGMLTSVKFDLSRIVRRTAEGCQEELHDIVCDLVVLVQDTIDMARMISNEARPASLDLLGLGAALGQTLDWFGVRHGIKVTMSGADAAGGLPSPVATQIFRIAQEALTNVARHAEARQVDLHLCRDGAAFVLRLRDDGRGFDPTQSRPGAIGLFSMAERAREIGAAIDISRGPEGGTVVSLRVPIVSIASTASCGYP